MFAGHDIQAAFFVHKAALFESCCTQSITAPSAGATHSQIHHPGKLGAGMIKPQVRVIMKYTVPAMIDATCRADFKRSRWLLRPGIACHCQGAHVPDARQPSA